MEMRKETKNWLEQSRDDFEKAKILFNSGHFDGSSFYCQQAVEKALKALIMSRSKERSVDGHSLIHLGKLAKAPQSYFSGLKKLSPQYFISRYPDVTEDVPYELYDADMAEEFMDIARDMLGWIGKQLK